MSLHISVREQLHAIEALLREKNVWQGVAPESSAFASSHSAWIRLPRWSGCSGC